MCRGILFCLFVGLCIACLSGTCKGQKKSRSPGTTVTDGCNLPCGCRELNPGSLEEKPVLWTDESSFRPQHIYNGFSSCPSGANDLWPLCQRCDHGTALRYRSRRDGNSCVVSQRFVESRLLFLSLSQSKDLPEIQLWACKWNIS